MIITVHANGVTLMGFVVPDGAEVRLKDDAGNLMVRNNMSDVLRQAPETKLPKIPTKQYLKDLTLPIMHQGMSVSVKSKVAREYRDIICPVITAFRENNYAWKEIAVLLNYCKVPTISGLVGKWTNQTVRNYFYVRVHA